MKLLLVAGARPNFMKVASIIEAIKEHNKSNNPKIQHYLVHTGQHYDAQMSDTFFRDLGLPKPDVDLGVGSAPHAEQTAEVMKRFAPVLANEQPDVVMVVGDVNSTIACSLVTSKMTYSRPTCFHGSTRPMVAHVESGLRSFDRSMPEEINRILTDALSDFLFITEESARENLMRENVPTEKIFFVGNTMVDTLLRHKDQADSSEILTALGLKKDLKKELGMSDVRCEVPQSLTGSSKENAYREYIVLTLHRPSNVDNRENFLGLLEAVKDLAQTIPVLFPIHPRTLGKIREFNFQHVFEVFNETMPIQVFQSGIHCLDSLGYLDFLCLLSHARLVLTDSGGIQEESTVLGIPCVTLRENTERPVTVDCGTNVIAGINRDNIVREALKQLGEETRIGSPPFWDGNAGRRIIEVLVQQATQAIIAPLRARGEKEDFSQG